MNKTKGFPKDARIEQIGGLFRRAETPEWRINLSISHDEIREHRNTLFSNATMLAKRRLINPTEAHSPSGFHLRFQVDSSQNWISSLNRESNQTQTTFQLNKFIFKANWLDKNSKLKQSVTIHLPQLELARALFFFTAYLSRSALHENILGIDFDIQPQQDSTLINILPSCSFPISHFNDAGIRRILSWILLDQEVRHSYESIAKHCTKYGYDSKNYRHWNFSFDPPMLINIIFDAYGYFKPETSEFFVNEITAISNLSSRVSNSVDFWHEKFKQLGKGSKGGARQDGSSTGQEPTASDDEDASDDGAPAIIETTQTLFNFINPIETRKVTKQTRGGSSQSGESNPESEDPSGNGNVSTDEPHAGGVLPPGEFEGAEDESDDVDIYLDRFVAFQQMIELFCSRHEVSSSMGLRLYKLPALKGFSKHLKNDGNPRCIAEIRFTLKQKHYVVLEVDTSDNFKPLSTQVLQIKDLGQWAIDFKDIRELLITKSLLWPRKRLVKVSQNKIWQLNHPRIDQKSKQISATELESWASRFASVLQ
ncbi:Tn7-like element transposition protein TnsE [Aquirhabdus sp.]|uniref:Tn7-like element transposition protein TnsE n=1 Tax=Aquirhabdus sp. TaxID=2824160 RepID=UPI00396CF092